MGRGDSRNTLKMKRRKSQTRLKARVQKRQADSQTVTKSKSTAGTPSAAPTQTTAKVRKRTSAS